MFELGEDFVPIADDRQRGGFDIVLVAGPGLSANASALAAFERAAQQWEAFITDSITVTIEADLANLGDPSTIGSTNLEALQVSPYSAGRTVWIADADGTNPRALTTGERESYLSPVWTPDGE